MKFNPVKLLNLTPLQINYLVAVIEGWQHDRIQDGQMKRGADVQLLDDGLNYCDDWRLAGELIERHKIDLIYGSKGCHASKGRLLSPKFTDPLKAVCTLLIELHFGRSLHIPEQLGANL